MPNSTDPRSAVIEQLRRDLGVVTERDAKTAVLCAEMGCGDMQAFIEASSELACPYAGQKEGSALCENIRAVYARAVDRAAAV